MTLQQLILDLASRSTKPNPSQAIWITACSDPVGENYADVLAQATLKLDDFKNFYLVEESKYTFLGSTVDIWERVVQMGQINSWADCVGKLGW